MNKIYLDVCSLCRPFDDQDYVRIRLETDAVNLILTKVKQNQFQLMKSKVHLIEISYISDNMERLELLELLKNYGKSLKVDHKKIQLRIEELLRFNFGVADASHIAFSEFYKAVFISCDDKLLNKCQKYVNAVKCLNPLTFCETENLK
jgi:predicted nucleic acid-binding protein